MSVDAANRDPLYLFACHLEWHHRRNLKAYEELLAALDDPNEGIRAVASHLLSHRDSPHPKHTVADLEDETW
jgi:hypothetical protein